MQRTVPVIHICHEYTIPVENALYLAIMRCNIGIVSTVYADEANCHIGV
ncbi:hypothetical protein [Brucella rhizosphaerae]|nr:hypothetical protein [Brucella rhizosphaerae]